MKGMGRRAMDKYEVLNNIQIYTDKYNETGYFPYAMQVFCWAHANDIPIPKDVLDALEKGFVEWGRCDGKESLDKIFNLKTGQGNSNPLSREWKVSRNRVLFTVMAKLMLLGWKVSDASEAACRWLEEQYKANPEKYKWLNPTNTGRKGDYDPKDGGLLSSESLLKEKRNNEQIFAESQRDAVQSMIFWSDEKKQIVEKFYRDLINRNVEKGSEKTTDELLKILVS